MTYEIKVSLGSYIRRKLGISLKEYSENSGVHVSTLQSRWQSNKGKLEIENAIFRYYVGRFDEL